MLYKGLFTTCLGLGLSHVRNRVQPYWGASTFIIQKLRELQESGWERVERNIIPAAAYTGRKEIDTAPTNWEMLCWLGALLYRKALRRLIRRPTVHHWQMAVRTGAPPVVDSTPAPNMDGFRWLESPKGRFYADPFVIAAEGKTWAFFEDFDYAYRRGKISCAALQAGGLGQPVTALERPYHLSYPCSFRDGAGLYMVPETASNGTAELYRCTRFPNVWELDRVLLAARAVDTTVWPEDGLYGFFITMQELHGRATQLCGSSMRIRFTESGHRIECPGAPRCRPRKDNR